MRFDHSPRRQIRSHVIGMVAVVVSATTAYAAMPMHDEICVYANKNGRSDVNTPRIVSRERLAKALLKQNPEWSQLYIDASENQVEAGPRWRQIFTARQFCVSDLGCLDPSQTKTGRPDHDAAVAVLNRVRLSAVISIQTETQSGKYYRAADPDMGTRFFLGDDRDQILCVGPDQPKPIQAKVIKVPDQLRLRATPDDLNISSADKERFIGTSPATINFTRNGADKFNTTRLQAALGYSFPLRVEETTVFSALFGQVIPYISASQSMTKVDGAPSTFAETNNVAAGTVIEATSTLRQMPGVAHSFSATPQYLWNTRDKSEIASLKLIYRPWTQRLVDGDGPNVKINTPFMPDYYIGRVAPWMQLIFDIRSNIGEYTNVGIDPATAILHQSFNRTGSQFGFALSTDPSGPHVVLKVTETLLYGFSGSVKYFDLFESKLSYYFDATSNFAFTVSYSKGRNEDTAEKAQTFMAGLAAKF